jgi:hypothetical protein
MAASRPTKAATTPAELGLILQEELGRAYFTGTRQQLIDEGLIPEGFRWPSRTEEKHFEFLGAGCSIRRQKPDTCSRWSDVDLWRLCRSENIGFKEALDAAEVRYKLRSYEALLRDDALPAIRAWCRANKDAPFQAFLQRLLA